MKICQNVNRIKLCMETGRTVILLNLENLYESLYDALNQVSIEDEMIGLPYLSLLLLQYYIKYDGKRYVDLGLQAHKVKCMVHENFKWVVTGHCCKHWIIVHVCVVHTLGWC